MTEAGEPTIQSYKTFRLSEQDRESILSQVSGTNTVIRSDNSSSNAVAERLETLRRRDLTLSLHQSTLVDYIKVNRIPRGLRSNLTPNLLTDDHEFITNWYGICNQSSQDLMYLMVKHLERKVQQVRSEIADTEQELLSTYTPERCGEINRSIEITIQRLKESILKVKTKKFDRDTRDYELNAVYSWNKKNKLNKKGPTSRRSPPPTNPASEQTTTDSDSGSSDNRKKRRSFLGRVPPREEEQGTSSQAPGQPQRPQTRAWSGRGKQRGRSQRR